MRTEISVSLCDSSAESRGALNGQDTQPRRRDARHMMAHGDSSKNTLAGALRRKRRHIESLQRPSGDSPCVDTSYSAKRR